jgi:hypothetical protein
MFASLLGEDGPIEWASAGLFAFAALAAVGRWRRLAGLGWLRPCAGLIAAICCLSELSFGARLFGWTMPAMRGGGELDGAHDVVLLVWRSASSWSPLLLAAVVAALVLASGAGLVFAAQAGATPRRIGRWLAADRRRALTALAFAALAIALGCDLLEQPRMRLVEEPLELLGAVLLALALSSSVRPIDWNRSPVRMASHRG